MKVADILKQVTGRRELLASLVDEEDIDDREGAVTILDEASAYLSGFSWVARVIDLYWGLGVGPKFGVILARIEPLGAADEWLWVIVGDVPPAYLDVLELRTPEAAIERYCELRDEWIDAVESGRQLDETIMPTNVPVTCEWAEELRWRIDMIRESIGERGEGLLRRESP